MKITVCRRVGATGGSAGAPGRHTQVRSRRESVPIGPGKSALHGLQMDPLAGSALSILEDGGGLPLVLDRLHEDDA
eukprot:COSAG03_NODE_1128_length_4764_cov_647.303751_5_plen_75_part_01